ncbi:MAG: hypothetical protein JEZ12_22930 [Desulfobacterium sp.]|nr:hypothetical protein [Desulfobacterium sp.]
MAKNTRSWLEKIVVKRRLSGKLNFSYGVIDRKMISIGPGFRLEPKENRFIGIVPRIGTTITIGAA